MIQVSGGTAYLSITDMISHIHGLLLWNVALIAVYIILIIVQIIAIVRKHVLVYIATIAAYLITIIFSVVVPYLNSSVIAFYAGLVDSTTAITIFNFLQLNVYLGTIVFYFALGVGVFMVIGLLVLFLRDFFSRFF